MLADLKAGNRASPLLPSGFPEGEESWTGPARHQLALLCRDQGRTAEAEALWRDALAEQPDLVSAWQGLGELALMQGRLAEVEAILLRLEARAAGMETAGLLRARLSLERREYAAARQVLAAVITREPQAPEPRRLLSYVLLQEGTDAAAAEQTLRELLILAPGDAEARHNLAVLLGRQGCAPSGSAPGLSQ
jgi:tetratricopeptide (TPR) repeat protein